jgi:hypothetical protein
VRRTPAALRFEDVAPEVHFAQDATHGVRLIAATRVRQRVDRVTRGVEAAVARNTGNRMCTGLGRKRILVQPALGDQRPALRPDEVVQHRAEPQAVRRLSHDPRTPAGDSPAALTENSTGLHQLVLASRLSAG